MVLMHRARDYILLSEFFSTVNSTLGFKTPIPDHLQETLQAYGGGLGIEIADAFACMSLIMFGSLFLNDRNLSPLLIEDFEGPMRERVDYFRNKRNQMIAHRIQFEAQEITFDSVAVGDVELGQRGRAIVASIPGASFAGGDRQAFLDIVERSLEILTRKWDDAFDNKPEDHAGDSTDT